MALGYWELIARGPVKLVTGLLMKPQETQEMSSLVMKFG